MELFIGGIHFDIDAQDRGPVHFGYAGTAYDSFLSHSPSPHLPIKISVSLGWGHIPQASKEKLLFDSGQSWQMYRQGEEYLLYMHPRTFETPIWMARFKLESDQVQVVCREDLKESPFRYPLDQLLSIYILALNRGLLIHSAGLNLNGEGIVLAGQSGAGKSTLTRQFTGKGKSNILSDDRILAREEAGSFLVHGTPWPGEEAIALNRFVPLKAILFLRHGKENRVQPLTPRQGLEKLMQTSSIPWYDRDILSPLLDTCESLVNQIPCFDFFFTPDPRAASFLENHFPSFLVSK